jgi:transposase-like protein
MRRYSTLEKDRAIELRLEGKSYSQIKNTLGINSKGTLSLWFKNLELPANSIKLLEDTIARATEKGLLQFNTLRTQRIKEENNEALRVSVLG